MKTPSPLPAILIAGFTPFVTARAAVEPFTDSSLAPAAPVFFDFTEITGFTTPSGSVDGLAGTAFLGFENSFDTNATDVGSAIRNFWGSDGVEITDEDGSQSLIGLDVSTGTLNAQAVDALFGFILDDAGAAGSGNDIFLVEIGGDAADEPMGNDLVTIAPLDADGQLIGDFTLTINEEDWGDIGADLDLVGDSLTVRTNHMAGVAFDLSDFVGTGALTGVAGVRLLTDSGGIDLAVVGYNAAIPGTVTGPPTPPSVNRITSLSVDAENQVTEIEITVDDIPVTYPIANLTQVDLINFNSDRGGVLVVPSEAVPPDTSGRAALIDGDLRVDTGVINLAEGSQSMSLEFLTPVTNAPGPDFIVLELASPGGPADPVLITVAEQTITYSGNDYTHDLTPAIPMDVYQTVGDPPGISDLADLESREIALPTTVNLAISGLAIDLSDFGIADGAQISEFSLGGGIPGSTNQIDPVFIAGLGAPAPSAQTLAVIDVTRDDTLGAVSIRFRSTIGQTYLIEKSEALQNWQVFLSGFPEGGATSTTTQIDDNGASTTAAFYRITEE